MTESPLIQDVSDTALWVATYRAMETKRPDALFQDPLAGLLAGDRGERIAGTMDNRQGTGWSVVIRTVMIDAFIQSAIGDGISTVLNLGAGLDTRPYRMDLPESLLWIEVDLPRIIDHKEAVLRSQKPRCNLERVRLDLSDQSARRNFFSSVNASRKDVLVLTEGVIPYLRNEDVASLARDLHLQSEFRFWIVDYLTQVAKRYVLNEARKRHLANAPWIFEPPADWFGFFRENGWALREIRYTAEEGFRLGRLPPRPPWMRILKILVSRKRGLELRRMAGYALMKKS